MVAGWRRPTRSVLQGASRCSGRARRRRLSERPRAILASALSSRASVWPALVATTAHCPGRFRGAQQRVGRSCAARCAGLTWCTSAVHALAAARARRWRAAPRHARHAPRGNPNPRDTLRALRAVIQTPPFRLYPLTAQAAGCSAGDGPPRRALDGRLVEAPAAQPSPPRRRLPRRGVLTAALGGSIYGEQRARRVIGVGRRAEVSPCAPVAAALARKPAPLRAGFLESRVTGADYAPPRPCSAARRRGCGRSPRSRAGPQGRGASRTCRVSRYRPGSPPARPGSPDRSPRH